MVASKTCALFFLWANCAKLCSTAARLLAIMRFCRFIYGPARLSRRNNDQLALAMTTTTNGTNAVDTRPRQHNKNKHPTSSCCSPNDSSELKSSISGPLASADLRRRRLDFRPPLSLAPKKRPLSYVNGTRSRYHLLLLLLLRSSPQPLPPANLNVRTLRPHPHVPA